MDAERIMQSYFSVSAAALMVYDYSITFHKEVDLLWPSRWSLVKVLFVLTRYSPFVDVLLDLYHLLAPNLSTKSCMMTFLVSRWLLLFGIAWAEVILLTRTWVLWDKKKSVLVTVVTIGLVALVCSITVFIVWTRSLVGVYEASRQQQAQCSVVTGSPIVGLSLLTVMLSESGMLHGLPPARHPKGYPLVVLALTLVRMVQKVRQSGRHIFRFSMFGVICRDGVIFFVYLFVISMINCVFIMTGPPVSRDLLVVLQRVLHSSLTSRMVLNLRKAGLQGGRDDVHHGPSITVV